MPNKVRKNSVVDMLAKVPVHRGSLIKGIENLLKTIEISESAVMIPTLLRDKCQFDAWELLFVAKILKASILGHIDLVEFYMNHIGLNSSQFAQQQQAGNGNHTSAASTPTAANAPSSTNGINNYPQSNGTASTSQDGQSTVDSHTNQQMASNIISPSASTTSSPISSPAINFAKAATTSTGSSSASWASAANGQPSNSGSTSGLSSSSSAGNTLDKQVVGDLQDLNSNDLLTQTIRPSVLQLQRQAQPPSLLQLTTTNNHINSVAQQHNHHQQQPATNIEQLASQLNSLQMASSPNGLGSGLLAATSSSADSTLSISTTYQHQQLHSQATAQASQVQSPAAELRASRSAGCLLRLNSGASSPRTPCTPTTPFSPQAETLGLNPQQSGSLAGDPSAPVKLLLQIEQLKSSIGHVTSLLESVVELYKESIDNIA